jgi:hypothetical protein
MIDYSKGELATCSEHLKHLELSFMDKEKYPVDKKFFLKIMPEAKYRSYIQIKCFKGITRLLHEANCLNDRLDSWEKIQYYMKLKCGLVARYVYFESGKTKFSDTKPKCESYAEMKSCAGMTKKEMTDLIDCTLTEADLNIDNMSLQMQKKYNAIRDEMEARR